MPSRLMDLSGYSTMDPHMLVGLVNTVMRNHCESLEDFCATYDIDATVLIERLGDAGYDYRPELKQFR